MRLVLELQFDIGMIGGVGSKPRKRFSRLYRLADKKDAAVADLWSLEGGSVSMEYPLKYMSCVLFGVFFTFKFNKKFTYL